MNIGSMHTDDDFYVPLYPTSSSLAAHPITFESSNSTLWFLNDIINDSSQTLAPSLPMQSHYTAEVHERFDFLKKNSELNQLPAALSEYPLCPEIPSTLHNSLLEAPYRNYQEIANYSLSTTLPEGSDEGCWMGDENGATNNSLSNVEGNQTSGENGCQTGQRLPQVGRRGHRKRPKRSFGERSSIYRGVSRYTGRFEAFLWDNTDPEEKPKTVYIGGFEHEEDAARAYDLAALKLWGKTAPINFSLSDYKKELEEMQYKSNQEYLLSIRR